MPARTRPVPLTAQALNRATLARQLLLERAPLDVVEGVRRVVALQAQSAASPYIGLWARLADFDPADLDRAFVDGTVVKASLMRLTLHAVAADDHRPFHVAMQSLLRKSRLEDPRFTVGELSAVEVEAMLAEVLAFLGEGRTNAEVEAWLAERLGAEAGRQAWWAIRTFAPLVHAVTGRPWSFGPRPAYRVAPAPHDRDDPAAALPILVRRYLEGFGPASVADISQFTIIPRGQVRVAIEALGEEFIRLEGSDGRELLDVPGGLLPDEDLAAPPRLLPMWDSILFAYDDRTRIIPPEHRRTVIRTNGDTLPTLLVDGRVAGVWRTTDDGIEATAFEPLDDDAWAGLEVEARSLVGLLAEREPRAYSRYGRWWERIEGAQVRVLGR
jgi:hypothetical protein